MSPGFVLVIEDKPSKEQSMHDEIKRTNLYLALC